MSRRLKIKMLLVVLLELFCVAGLGYFLDSLQTHLSTGSQKQDIVYKMEQVEGLVKTAHQEVGQTRTTFDSIYQSKAKSLAYMVNMQVGGEPTAARMAEYKRVLNVDNVL